MTWLPCWYYRKKITISASNVDDELADFPLRVPISQSDLQFHQGQADGDDIRFTAADGVTLLPHVWTGWADDDDAGAYVKIPSIGAATDTTIYLYYGNASAADASQAASVLADYLVFAPLRNWSEGQLELASDLAVAKNHASAQVTAVAEGVRFGGSYGLKVGDTQEVFDLLDGRTGMTISCVLRDFIYPLATVDTDVLLAFRSGDYSDDVYLGTHIRSTQASNPSWIYNNYNNGVSRRFNESFDSGLAVDVSHSKHFAMTHRLQSSLNYTELKLYLDAIALVSQELSSSETTYLFGLATDPLMLGGHQYLSTIPSTMADFRIRKDVASAAWIKFEHANLINAGNEITLGSEESLPVVPGPYSVVRADTFQTDVQQSETFIPGIFAGHTHGI